MRSRLTTRHNALETEHPAEVASPESSGTKMMVSKAPSETDLEVFAVDIMFGLVVESFDAFE